jgi:hypothetical protein
MLAFGAVFTCLRTFLVHLCIFHNFLFSAEISPDYVLPIYYTMCICLSIYCPIYMLLLVYVHWSCP